MGLSKSDIEIRKKYNNPKGRYGVIYTARRLVQCKKRLNDIEIIEWADTLPEVYHIEEILKDLYKDIRTYPNRYSNYPEDEYMYGYFGYVVADYQEKRIVKMVKQPFFSFDFSKFERLLLMDVLFTPEEMFDTIAKMSDAEYVGWLRFTYGDGLNAINDGVKPIGTEELYEEMCLKKIRGRRIV